MYKAFIKNIQGLIAILFGLSVLNSCIDNDIPYPRIKMNFTAFEIEGQIAKTEIDTVNNLVTIPIGETVNLKTLAIKSYKITESATITPEPGATIDLSEPQKFTLSFYQDYIWTVKARQNLNRSFEIEGQFGESEIDSVNYVAVAYVPMEVPLSKVPVKTLKLGPSNATMSPSVQTYMDFTSPRTFTVKYHDITEMWTVYVIQTEQSIATQAPDAFASKAYLHGVGKAGGTNGFDFRLASETAWTTITGDRITSNGGTFNATVTGLTPQTQYIVRAFSDGNYGEEITFSTEEPVLLTHGSFDEWHQNGKVWNPWPSGAMPYWDTGNRGATTLGDSNTNPTSDTSTGSGQAAKLDSKFVGIAGIGKFAAGNIFFGEYVRTDGTNGILSFGRPFDVRPSRLRFSYKYTSQPINRTADEFTYLKGRPDSCHIYVSVGDWDTPVEIRTKPSERKLFERNDPNVIAYGEFITAENTSTYQQVEVPLVYQTTSRKPTHLVVVCTASKYGDYFTGGEGSTLWVDNMELLYD